MSKTTPVVLVVEDEMVLRMRAVDIVTDAGFTAVEATSADQALEILEKRNDISLIFSDIQMPGKLDGLKLAHEANARWPHIKIILVSGKVELTERDKPYLSLFFPKPLEISQMVQEIRTMIGPNSHPATEVLVADNAVLTTEIDALKTMLEQERIDAKELLVQAGIAADERDASDKLQELIHAEMHHRMKNMLATVSAITHQSLRTATRMDHASSAIDGRFAALARAHDLLTKVSWAEASIECTVQSAVAPYDQGGGRFTIKGKDIKIVSSSVIALAMTLNELCTNAVKYGALSVPAGRVDVSWTVKGKHLCFSWRECNGPKVKKPKSASFGTRMMTSLGSQLNGEVKLDYRPTGFVFTLDAPLVALKAKSK